MTASWTAEWVGERDPSRYTTVINKKQINEMNSNLNNLEVRPCSSSATSSMSHNEARGPDSRTGFFLLTTLLDSEEKISQTGI